MAYTWRSLWRSRSLATAVTLTLALCIAANVLVFGILYRLVLQPPPFADPGRLIEIYDAFPKLGVANYASNVSQYLDYSRGTPDSSPAWGCSITRPSP